MRALTSVVALTVDGYFSPIVKVIKWKISPRVLLNIKFCMNLH